MDSMGNKIIKIANKTLNAVIALVVLIVLTYSLLGLWDIYMIYRGANNSDIISSFKPKGTVDDELSFVELQKINPDVCAWLTIDDTKIDYPVVQGKTNMEYINKAVDGSFSLSGSIFLDYRNKRDFKDDYSLIYGHHMEGEMMFGSLVSFLEEDFFHKHQKGTLYRSDGTKTIEIFACVESDAYDTVLFQPIGSDKASRQTLLHRIQEKAVQYRDISLQENEDIIGLSTCYNTKTNGRILVFGRLTESQ